MLSVLAAVALLQSDRPLASSSEGAYAAKLFQEETFEFAPGKLRSLASIDLWQGEAKLADGQCLILRVVAESATRQPVISKKSTACVHVSPTTGIPAVRCSGLDRLVGLWRIGCRKHKSAYQLFAVHSQSARMKLLSVSKSEVIFASAFGLHDRIMIRTLALRTDGKAVISHYQWNPQAS